MDPERNFDLSWPPETPRSFFWTRFGQFLLNFLKTPEFWFRTPISTSIRALATRTPSILCARPCYLDSFRSQPELSDQKFILCFLFPKPDLFPKSGLPLFLLDSWNFKYLISKFRTFFEKVAPIWQLRPIPPVENDAKLNISLRGFHPKVYFLLDFWSTGPWILRKATFSF